MKGATSGERRHWLAFLVCISALWNGSSPADTDPLSAADASLLIEHTLGIQSRADTDPLASMQDWNALYVKYRDRAYIGEDYAIRVLLLFAFTAVTKVDAAISEALSSDLMPLFTKHPALVMQALADNPWLVPSTCYFLGKSFDFEGRGGKGRASFLSQQRATFLAALPPDCAERCLRQLTLPERPE